MSSKHRLTRRDVWSLAADPLVHIASLLVQGTSAGCAAVGELVRALPGAEVHPTPHPGKVVVVLESSNDRAIADTAAQLAELAGVVNVSIVAHHAESASALQEEHIDGQA